MHWQSISIAGCVSVQHSNLKMWIYSTHNINVFMLSDCLPEVRSYLSVSWNHISGNPEIFITMFVSVMMHIVRCLEDDDLNIKVSLWHCVIHLRMLRLVFCFSLRRRWNFYLFFYIRMDWEDDQKLAKILCFVHGFVWLLEITPLKLLRKQRLCGSRKAWYQQAHQRQFSAFWDSFSAKAWCCFFLRQALDEPNITAHFKSKDAELNTCLSAAAFGTGNIFT